MVYTLFENGREVCPKCKSSNLDIKDNRTDRFDRDIDVECVDCEWEGFVYDES